MSVYYFHLRAGPRVELDAVGREFDDLAAAKRHAVDVAAERIDDSVGSTTWRIEVADAAGQYLTSIDRDGVVTD